MPCAIWCVAGQDLRVQLPFIVIKRRRFRWQRFASLAGVSWAQMKNILAGRHGIQPRLGPETLAEAEQEVNV